MSQFNTVANMNKHIMEFIICKQNCPK